MPKQKRKKRPTRPLTEAQKQAAVLLFNGERIGQIAAILGVHRATLWRWRTRRGFQNEINRVHDRYLRDYRRAWLKKYHNSPEYKRRRNRRYYARRKLKELSAKLDKAQTATEHQILWKQYEKTYNDAYFDGKTPAEILNCSRFSCTKQKARKEPKYIIEIL